MRYALCSVVLAMVVATGGCKREEQGGGGSDATTRDHAAAASRASGASVAPSSVQAPRAATRAAARAWDRRVVAEKTGRISAEGGAVAFDSGLQVSFPAGAVDRPIDVTMRILDGGAYFGDGGAGRIVVECVAPVTKFAKPVELRVPLPPTATQKEADEFVFGYLDEKTGAINVQPITIESAGGKSHLVARTDHFTSFVMLVPKVYAGYKLLGAVGNVVDMAKFGLWDRPPATCDPIQIPIYCQGDSPECVSASLEMTTKAVNANCGEVWKIMEAGGIKGGLANITAAWSSGLYDELTARSGAAPTICWWDTVFDMRGTPLMGPLKRYLCRAIGNRKHPVVFCSTALKDQKRPTKHAVVLVGYDDQDNWWVVNPQLVSGNTRKPVKMTAAELGLSWNIRHNFLTVELNKDPLPQQSMPTLTINMPMRHVWFEGKGGADKTVYAFDWDGRYPGGATWVQKAPLDAGESGDLPVAGTIPGDTVRLAMRGSTFSRGLEVTNCDPAQSADAQVSFEVENINTGSKVALGTGTALTKSVSIPPQSRAYVPFNVELKPLRGKSASDQRFRATATVSQAGRVGDKLSFEFVLAPELLPVGYWVLKEHKSGVTRLYDAKGENREGVVTCTTRRVKEHHYEDTQSIKGEIRLKKARLVTDLGVFENIELDYSAEAASSLEWQPPPVVIPVGATWDIVAKGKVQEQFKPDQPVVHYFVGAARSRAGANLLFGPDVSKLSCGFDILTYADFEQNLAKGFHQGTMMMLGRSAAAKTFDPGADLDETFPVKFKQVPDGTTQTSEVFIILVRGYTSASSITESYVYQFRKELTPQLSAALKVVEASEFYTPPPAVSFAGAKVIKPIEPAFARPGETRFGDLRHVPPQIVAMEEAVFELAVEKAPLSASYSWDFGEPFFKGQAAAWTETNRCKYTFGKAGRYTVTVTIRDKAKYAVVLDKRSWVVDVAAAKAN